MKKLLFTLFFAFVFSNINAQSDTISYYKKSLPVTIPCQLWAMVGDNVIFKTGADFDSVKTKDIIAIIPLPDSRFIKQYGLLMHNINTVKSDDRPYRETAAYHLKNASTALTVSAISGGAAIILPLINSVSKNVEPSSVKTFGYVGIGLGVVSTIGFIVSIDSFSRAANALDENKIGRMQLNVAPTGGRLIYKF